MQGATDGAVMAQARQPRAYELAAMPSPSPATALPPPPLPGSSPTGAPISPAKSKGLFDESQKKVHLVDAATPLLKDRRESSKDAEKDDKKEVVSKETVATRVLVTVTLKHANLTAKQKALLKALGFVESSKEHDKTSAKLARNQVRGMIALSRVKNLRALEFVQSVLLASDRK